MAALDNLKNAITGLQLAVTNATTRESTGATEAEVQTAADAITAVTADVDKIGQPPTA